ncbi:MAG: hypothetical protein KGZ58_13780 [Ignavibacteriales bacterium]|nr:hypothetical protein [Ignavibacteriales bacterium]
MKIKTEHEIVITFSPPWIEGELLLCCYDERGTDSTEVSFEEVWNLTVENLLPEEKQEVKTELVKRLRKFLKKLESSD